MFTIEQVNDLGPTAQNAVMIDKNKWPEDEQW